MAIHPETSIAGREYSFSAKMKGPVLGKFSSPTTLNLYVRRNRAAATNHGARIFSL